MTSPVSVEMSYGRGAYTAREELARVCAVWPWMRDLADKVETELKRLDREISDLQERLETVDSGPDLDDLVELITDVVVRGVRDKRDLRRWLEENGYRLDANLLAA